MRYLIGLLLLIISTTSSAQTVKDYIRNDWPDSRYEVHDNGTTTDTYTGLMWKVCSEGQTWSSPATCSGNATSYNWQQALELANSASFAGFDDWRLPNIAELRSLAAKNCYSPAINVTVFPNTPSIWFWSSSPYGLYSNGAWFVNFSNGHDITTSRSVAERVRLVRAGQ